jgi:hypothetical protein
MLYYNPTERLSANELLKEFEKISKKKKIMIVDKQ